MVQDVLVRLSRTCRERQCITLRVNTCSSPIEGMQRKPVARQSRSRHTCRGQGGVFGDDRPVHGVWPRLHRPTAGKPQRAVDDRRCRDSFNSGPQRARPADTPQFRSRQRLGAIGVRSETKVSIPKTVARRMQHAGVRCACGVGGREMLVKSTASYRSGAWARPPSCLPKPSLAP
jgi:hypothetical protein